MSEQLSRNPNAGGEPGAQDQLHLLDLLVVLAEHKWLVIGTPVITGTVALVASLFITPSFTSTLKLMPPQQQSSSGVAAMLGSLGSLTGAAGGLAGLKNPNDLYVGMLESRTVGDSLIKRFSLHARYDTKTMDDTRKTLAGATEIANGSKDGFISISASDRDPVVAAALANAYGEELAKLTQTIALTEASQRRLFFEKQLQNVRDELANAELALRKTQEKTGLIKPDSQVQAIIANAAQLRGTIAAKEVQLKSIRTFATDQNPELLRVQEELRALRGQLAQLESSGPGKDGDFMVAPGKIPEVGVEYVRSARNVKYYETIFELLAKQFELSKIDEAKESTLIQVLDKAIPAERKSKPSRVKITLAGIFAGAMLGVVIALLRAAYSGSRRSSTSAPRWQRLEKALSWRRAHV